MNSLKKIICVANEIDSKGQYILANQLTKIAETIASKRMAKLSSEKIANNLLYEALHNVLGTDQYDKISWKNNYHKICEMIERIAQNRGYQDSIDATLDYFDDRIRYWDKIGDKNSSTPVVNEKQNWPAVETVPYAGQPITPGIAMPK